MANTANKARKRAGFTMGEVLVAVAIVVILALIAVPSGAAVKRSMDLVQLDAYAKELYLSAQNALIAKDAAGQIGGSDGFGTKLLAKSGNSLGQSGVNKKPLDYPDDDEDHTYVSWENLYYLASSDDLAAELFGAGSLASDLAKSGTSSLAGGHSDMSYILELDSFGNVYSAFCREGAGFDYADIAALSSRGSDARSRAAGGAIGYYCGGATQAQKSIQNTFEPQIQLVNGNDLFAIVTCDMAVEYRATQNNLVLTLYVMDKTTGAQLGSLQYAGGTDFQLADDGSLNAELVLDSLDANDATHHLTALAGSDSMTPGGDIGVTATLTHSFNGAVTMGETASEATANALFGAGSSANSIKVANLRHLLNLKALTAEANASAGKAEIEQTESINFNPAKWNDGSHEWARRAATNVVDGAAVNPYAQSGMAPVAVNTGTWEYAGNGKKLRNFVVTGAAGEKNTGVFAAVGSGSSISNLQVVNSQAAGGENTGMLVGELNGTLESCGAALDNAGGAIDEAAHTVTGTTCVGGLVGRAGSGACISKCYAAVNVSGESAVGGLTGAFENANANSSYASGAVTADSTAGGFAGKTAANGGGDDANISDCYTTSPVAADTNVGGFYGTSTDGVNIEGVSYGLVTKKSGAIPTTGNFGGFGGDSNAATLGCSYLRQLGYNDMLPIEAADAKRYDELVASSASTLESMPYASSLSGKKLPFPALQEQTAHYGNWPLVPGIQPTLAYYERYGDGSSSDTYGFYAQTQLANVGDRSDTAITLNSLSDTKTIYEDGYAVLTSFPVDSLTGGASGSSSLNALGSVSSAYWRGESFGSVAKTAPNNEYLGDVAFAYKLPLAAQGADANGSISMHSALTTSLNAPANIDIADSFTYLYNPHFAKEAINPAYGKSVATNDSSSVDYHLRTAKHLSALSRHSGYWNATNIGTFYQERDIDFSTYTTSYLGSGRDFTTPNRNTSYGMKPIGATVNDGTKFTGTYNGLGNRVYDCSISSVSADRFVGIFGIADRATIKNAHFVAHSKGGAHVSNVLSSSVNNPASAGGLLGKDNNKSQIINCSIAGYNITMSTEHKNYTGNCSVGALVGVGKGTIESCAATSCVVTCSSGVRQPTLLNNEKIYSMIGGLVGAGTGTISNSYAICDLVANPNLESTVLTGRYDGMIGGILARKTGGNNNPTDSGVAAPVITNCYSLCTRNVGNIGSSSSWQWLIDILFGSSGMAKFYGICSETNGTGCYYADLGSDKVTDSTSSASIKKTLANLRSQSLMSSPFGSVDESLSTYGASGSYPYPALYNMDAAVIASDEFGDPSYTRTYERKRIHYGDWPS